MPNVKYTDSATFRCLENLKEGSLDISLIHTGKEHCPPGHICSMPRDEFIIHFVLDGTGFYSAGGQTWSLTPGQMFVIIQMNQSHTVLMKPIPGLMPGLVFAESELTLW